MVTSQAIEGHVAGSARVRSATLRDYVTQYRSELIEQLTSSQLSGLAVARKHAAIADDLVRDVFAKAREGCDGIPLLLGAVGGYGRGLIALGSDLDLCFITTAHPNRTSACVKAMLYALWDAGVRVGHQVIRTSEVVADASADHKIATELLDFRPLGGDESLLEAIHDRLADTIFSESKVGEYIAQLEAGAKKRHEQFGESVYLLEPDVKSGTGGLRDLDSALWAARARFGTSRLGELVQLGVITQPIRRDVERALEFVWTVRNHLHRVAGRKADRLTFAAQERVAESMGYARDDDEATTRTSLQRTGEMVEAFMSDYYRHARVIAQTRDRILGHAKRRHRDTPPEMLQLGNGLVECEGRVGLAEPDRVGEEPSLAFRVYGLAVQRDMEVLSRTRDAIAAAVADPEVCARLRASTEAANLCLALICSNRPVRFASRSILGELHDVGLLLAMIPEFAPVVGRVHHDLYHVYTVDVHSIAAVDRLHSLARGELTAMFPLASRLAAEAVRPEVLFMATLLHDVGKAIGGRNHALRGAEMARTILARFNLAHEEIEDVCRLVLHHLTMYMVAIRRDLSDPTTISEFVRNTWDRDSLRDLYLLTVADVSTTSPEAMTHWKRSMLDALFRRADAHLAGVLAGPTDRVARVRDRARALWPHEKLNEEFDRFTESMPARYFLANSAEEVVAHAELALRREEDRVAVSWVPSSHDGILGLCVVAEAHSDVDLCVVADDRPGLLASIAAAISASRFDIQAAQVNSRPLQSGGYQAVDLFYVRSPANDGATEQRLARLKRDLSAVLRGEVAPEALVGARNAASRSQRPTPAVVTEVLFDHHASDQYTVIEVLAEDRPALLFTLASALRELNISISVAKISTEGKRAVDVLYATEVDGSKIEPGGRTEEVRAKLLAQLAPQSRQAG